MHSITLPSAASFQRYVSAQILQNLHLHNNSVWQCSKRNVHVPLTSACCVYSNIYGLCDIHCIAYLTAVKSFLSTSSPVQSYHHMTSCSVDVPLISTARNSSSIGEEPVPSDTPHGMRRSATISFINQAEQSSIAFTDVLQDHKTVVLVYCTIE